MELLNNHDLMIEKNDEDFKSILNSLSQLNNNNDNIELSITKHVVWTKDTNNSEVAKYSNEDHTLFNQKYSDYQ